MKNKLEIIKTEIEYIQCQFCTRCIKRDPGLKKHYYCKNCNSLDPSREFCCFRNGKYLTHKSESLSELTQFYCFNCHRCEYDYQKCESPESNKIIPACSKCDQLNLNRNFANSLTINDIKHVLPDDVDIEYSVFSNGDIYKIILDVCDKCTQYSLSLTLFEGIGTLTIIRGNYSADDTIFNGVVKPIEEVLSATTYTSCVAVVTPKNLLERCRFISGWS